MKTNQHAAAAAGARWVPELPFPISRRTDPVSVRVGVRVIVRMLATAEDASIGSASAVTDVIGVLRSIEPLQVNEVIIPAENVIVLKTLSAAPVRNSDIRAVEEAAAAAFPGITNTMIGGWLARAGDGITERSNSAVPIGPTAGMQPVPVDDIRAFYAQHDLPPLLMLPDRIARSAESLPGTKGVEIIVMTRLLNDLHDVEPELAALGGLAAVPAPGETEPLPAPGRIAQPAPGAPVSSGSLTLTIAEQPTDEWLSMYHFRGQQLPVHALNLLRGRINGHMCFASLHVDGELAAITRGTVTSGGGRDWLGFSAVEVAPAYRRRGLASTLGAAMLHWGQSVGADAAYLDVMVSNVAGRALYHRLGFSEHHRHRVLALDTLAN